MKLNRISPLAILSQVMVVLLCALTMAQFHHHGCDDHYNGYDCECGHHECGHHESCPADMSPFEIVKPDGGANLSAVPLHACHCHTGAIATECPKCVCLDIAAYNRTPRHVVTVLPDLPARGIRRRGPPAEV